MDFKYNTSQLITQSTLEHDMLVKNIDVHQQLVTMAVDATESGRAGGLLGQEEVEVARSLMML